MANGKTGEGNQAAKRRTRQRQSALKLSLGVLPVQPWHTPRPAPTHTQHNTSTVPPASHVSPIIAILDSTRPLIETVEFERPATDTYTPPNDCRTVRLLAWPGDVECVSWTIKDLEGCVEHITAACDNRHAFDSRKVQPILPILEDILHQIKELALADRNHLADDLTASRAIPTREAPVDLQWPFDAKGDPLTRLEYADTLLS